MKMYEYNTFQQAFFIALGLNLGHEFMNAFLENFNLTKNVEQSIKKAKKTTERFNKSDLYTYD